MTQVATFHIGDEIFGVDILLTKEIGKINEITKVPQSQPFILGLMNLRGQIVTIMDPGVFLEQKSAAELDDKRLIILKTEDELEPLRRNNLIQDNFMSRDPLAIVIDSMGDVLEIETNQILQPPANLSGVKREFVCGILQQGKQLVILLDISKIARMCIENS